LVSLLLDGVELRCEVGILNRNIIIQGDDASASNGFGGHTMFLAGTF